jgi:hypothetical protein
VSDSNVIKLAQPGAFTDSLTEILRSGARAPLTRRSRRKLLSFSQSMPISRPRRASSGWCRRADNSTARVRQCVVPDARRCGRALGDIVLRVESVELGALNQGVDRRGAASAGIGASEQIIFPAAYGNTAQRAPRRGLQTGQVSGPHTVSTTLSLAFITQYSIWSTTRQNRRLPLFAGISGSAPAPLLPASAGEPRRPAAAGGGPRRPRRLPRKPPD